MQEECWLYAGSLNGSGYGRISLAKGGVMVHRAMYEALVGPIPEGLQLDHLCRVRHCVNPSHLEPVTHRENMLRGTAPSAINARRTHCQKGHPFVEGNIKYSKAYTPIGPPRKWRNCRICWRAAQNRYYAKKKLRMSAGVTTQ